MAIHKSHQDEARESYDKAQKSEFTEVNLESSDGLVQSSTSDFEEEELRKSRKVKNKKTTFSFRGSVKSGKMIKDENLEDVKVTFKVYKQYN